MGNITPEFAAALIKATSEIAGAVRDSKNPFFNSTYADLESVVNAVKGPLIKNGITFLQKVMPDSEACVETLLIYKSGEILSAGIIKMPLIKTVKRFDKESKQYKEESCYNAQLMGAGITYARRIGLAAALGVPQVDDDGNHASGRQDLGRAQPEPRKEQTKSPVEAAPSNGEPVIYYIPSTGDEEKDTKRRMFFEKRGAQFEDGLWYSASNLGPKLEEFRIKSEAELKAAKLGVEIQKSLGDKAHVQGVTVK